MHRLLHDVCARAPRITHAEETHYARTDHVLRRVPSAHNLVTITRIRHLRYFPHLRNHALATLCDMTIKKTLATPGMGRACGPRHRLAMPTHLTNSPNFPACAAVPTPPDDIICWAAHAAWWPALAPTENSRTNHVCLPTSPYSLQDDPRTPPLSPSTPLTPTPAPTTRPTTAAGAPTRRPPRAQSAFTQALHDWRALAW